MHPGATNAKRCLAPLSGWVGHYREKTSGQNSSFRALAKNHLCPVPPSALQIYVMSVTACGNFQTCKICPCPHLHPNCTADVPFCPVAVRCIRAPRMPKDALQSTFTPLACRDPASSTSCILPHFWWVKGQSVLPLRRASRTLSSTWQKRRLQRF